MDQATLMHRINSIPGNPHALVQLQARLESGAAIAFVGAGASAGLYPMWTSLIALLAEDAVNRGWRPLRIVTTGCV